MFDISFHLANVRELAFDIKKNDKLLINGDVFSHINLEYELGYLRLGQIAIAPNEAVIIIAYRAADQGGRGK